MKKPLHEIVRRTRGRGTATLPDMQGSGVVRDLREAASLSPALLATLGQYAQSATSAGQHQLLDALVSGWGATSGLADMQARAAANGYTLTTNLDAAHLARLTALEQFDGRVAAQQRGTHRRTPCGCNGRSFYRLLWREVANDAVCEMRRVG